MTEVKPSRLGPRALAILDYIERVYPCGAIPHGALTDISQVYGVSPERVRQIVNRAGIDRVPRIPGDSRTKGCRHCSKPAGTGIPYCEEHRYVPLVCGNCNEEFRVRPSEVRSRLRRNESRKEAQFFCSRKCYGAYSGRNYGFAAHPENRRHGLTSPTHCPHGHEFTEANTYLYGRVRQCKTCTSKRNKERYQRQRASNQQATPAPSTPSTTNSAPAPVGGSPAGSTAATSEEHRQ